MGRPRPGAFARAALALTAPLPAFARPTQARSAASHPPAFATAELRYAQNQQPVPLEQVIQSLHARYPGSESKSLDARILERPGAVLYEIIWLTQDGRKLVITVDAATGQVIGTKGMP